MAADERHPDSSRIAEAAWHLRGEAREAYLRQALAGQEELREEVEAELQLLDALPGASSEAERAPALAAETVTTVFLRKLAAQTSPPTRYRGAERIGGGAMGDIYKIRDQNLRRLLAKKVMKRQPPGSAHEGLTEERRLRRFIEEAQVTGQLDHPGVVPVHELGVDEDGSVYFTMRLVRGRDLGDVFELVKKGEKGWNLARALSMLLRVCEAMAFAHERNIVHRDLKPSNIRVGRFGEVYVMDWGLARVLGGKESKDIRLRRQGDSTSVTLIRAGILEEGEEEESPLVTMDGDVMGTPAYMAPEQARGDVERVGPRSDVYSVGAILYELLAGQPPYAVPGVKLSPYAIWKMVLEAPPRPVDEVHRGRAPELVAICEKAMAREPAARYANMSEMAEDLRRFLENRVVQAYRTGAVAEARKWVRRNRGVAALATALLLVAAAALLGFLWFQERKEAQVRRANDALIAAGLIEQVDDFGAIAPENLGQRERWLQKSRELLARAPQYREELARLRAAALPGTEALLAADVESHPLRNELGIARLMSADLPAKIAELEEAIDDPTLSAEKRRRAEEEKQGLEQELAEFQEERDRLEAIVTQRRTFLFEDHELQERHDELTGIVEDLDRLEREALPQVEAEALAAATLRRRSIEEHADRWQAAAEAVAADPRYEGVTLRPQTGLVPLGADPLSGLQEFWHVLSGNEPRRAEDRRIVLEPESAVVLVLMPGGSFDIGSQSSDPLQPRYAKEAGPSEGPPLRVELAPFFLSKYELTKAQWSRLGGEDLSTFLPGTNWSPTMAGISQKEVITPLHPAETMNFREARAVLARHGLSLPTGAQWEIACRCSGGDVSVAANRHGLSSGDRFLLHAPVDAFPPDGCGFLGMRGNVREMCLDWYADDYEDVQLSPGSGEIVWEFRVDRTLRGAGWGPGQEVERCSQRFPLDPEARSQYVGIRPARPLEE